jgi:hypothetical protein
VEAVGDALETAGDAVEAAGASIEVAGAESVEITLVWRAASAATSRYKASVQVVDAGGLPLVQHDAEPANWDRPTTGWVPGEVVEDPHALVVPRGIAPGAYRIVVALYDAATGARAQITSGAVSGDQVDLGVLVVPSE